MKRLFMASIIPVGVSAFLILMWLLLKDVTIDVLEPTGKVGKEQRDILYFTLILSVVVVVPVFTMLGLFAYKYREGRGADYKPEVGGNNRLEAIWWGVPIIIILILAVVTWQSTHSLDPYRKIKSDNETIRIQVIALQWKWLFIYPDYGIATVNELPIPVDHPIHFTLAADAPMSSFWVPSLGSQIYSMNGMSSELNLMAEEIGEYVGYNTNINGLGYSDMKFTVKSIPHKSFARWAQKTSHSEDSFSMHDYDKLSQPSVQKSPRAYRLNDTDLYDTIVAKYMHGMSHGTTSDAAHDDHGAASSTQDHTDTSHHEGHH